MRKNISETIREEMKDLHDASLIDETTMRKFDKNSLEPAKTMSKQDVKRIQRLNKKDVKQVDGDYSTGLKIIRAFAAHYQNSVFTQALPGQLSWTHYFHYKVYLSSQDVNTNELGACIVGRLTIP